MATEELLRELKMQYSGLMPLQPAPSSSSSSPSIQMTTEQMMERNYLKLRSIYGIPVDSGAREQEREAHQHVPESSVPLCEQEPGHNLVPREPVIITRPSSNDVVSGKGEGIQNHSGNVRFRKLLEPYLDEYNRAPRSKRPKIVALLHQHLTTKGFRFLKEAAFNEWVEGDAAYGERKIAQWFRSLRKIRDKLRNQQQGNKASGVNRQAAKSPAVAKLTSIPRSIPKDASIIITPSETDVLSGKGTGLIHDNPGNVNFRRFIEAHWEEYDRIKRTAFEDRKMLLTRLIHQLAADKVRFLKKDGAGHWVTLDETEVKKKVNQLFQNIGKKKKKKKNNTAIPQPTPKGASIIITPSATDVLSGRFGVRDNPGNVTFRRFIEAHWEEYDRAGWQDRRILIRRLTKQLAADKVRFLKQLDGTGHWVTLDETEVQKKVSQQLQNIGQKKNRNACKGVPSFQRASPSSNNSILEGVII